MKENKVGMNIRRSKFEELTKRKSEKGITLIALIITIVVMLILVVVSVRIALETGLFETAGKATKNWSEEQEKEAELGLGKVTIGGVTYNSIGEYTNSIKTEENEGVDFEKLFETAEKHPEQIETNDIGIAEDGSIVNLDLWYYQMIRNGSSPEGYSLGAYAGTMYFGYTGEVIDGKIQGEVPMYIKDGENNSFYPVISMNCTFAIERNLTVAPEIPSSVTRMEYTFSSCTGLIEAPKIPSSVTYMDYTFNGCTSLTKAPEIPSSVTVMSGVFGNCSSLTEAPEIPSSVTDISGTFYDCISLTGTLTINANPTDYSNCLRDVATAEGCNLVLNGSSTMLNEILATKSDNSNITIGN